jgi:hypothetical protein
MLVCVLLVALAAVGATAARSAGGTPVKVFEIGNVDAVQNGPSAPSIVRTTKP